MKLSTAIGRFLLNRKSHCSPRTVAWYSNILTALAARFPDTSIEQITRDDLEQFVIDQRTRERRDTRGTHGNRLSDRTIEGMVRGLRIFFHFWWEMSVLSKDPSSRLKAPRNEESEQPLSYEQVNQLFAVLDEGKWPSVQRDRAVFLFMMDTGCRAEEVITADLSKLNLDERWCDVVGKGHKSRRVGLSPRTVVALRAYLGSRQSGRIFLTDHSSVAEVTGAERPLTYAGLRQIVRRMSKRTGLPLHPHLFRRTFATLFIDDGGETSHLQVLMGHAQIEMTNHYAQAARAMAALKEHRIHSPVNRIGKAKHHQTKQTELEPVFIFSPMDELAAQQEK